MTWDEAKLKVVFWQSGAWVPHPADPPGVVDDPSKILTLLGEWYATSIGKAAIDKVIERYGFIRIGDSDDGGLTIRGTATNDGYFLVDSDDTPHDHWLTPDGRWVESSLSISLLHEIMHLGWQYQDPSHWRGIANQPLYETTMNGAEYDYAGEVVRQVNAALLQRGLGDQQRSSYQAVLLPDNLNNAAFESGVSYTGGATVSFSRIGFRGRDDNMDISARTDGANALMFGLDGQDTLVGNRGNDFLYGGDNDDVLTGGGGNDQLWGGTLNESERTDGIDTARYQSAPGAITINISGGAMPTITVQDGEGGTDTLRSIEIIEGSAFNDTLVVSALTPEVVGAFDMIDLGAGTDTIDVSRVDGAVTVNLTNPAAQTAALNGGGATLRFSNVEEFRGSADGDDTFILSATGSRVDGNGSEVVTANSLFHYAGFGTIQGSSGNDRMFGGLTGHYVAGSGTSYLEGGGSQVNLESTTGDTYFHLTGGGTIISGAGNDYIEVNGPEPVTIKFGIGSGHDMLGFYFRPDTAWVDNRSKDTIEFVGLMPNDVELIWNYTERYLYGYETQRIGEAAIRIKSTGETLHLGILRYSVGVDSPYGTDKFIEIVYLEYTSGALGEELNGRYDYNEYEVVPSYDVELDIFLFSDGIKHSTFDLFDLYRTPSTFLPVEVTAASDILSRIGSGSDAGFIEGTPGADNLAGSSANDDIFAGDGDDIVNAGAGDDVIRGGGGNDLLIGGPGNNDINGGAGYDSVSYASAPSGVVANLAAGTVAGGAGIDRLSGVENLIGSALNDSLTGNSLANDLNGGAGSDVISGGTGVDRLTGGAGTDTFRDTAAGLSGDVIVDFSVGDRIVISDANPRTFTFTVSGTSLSYGNGYVKFEIMPEGRIVSRAADGGGVELTIRSSTKGGGTTSQSQNEAIEQDYLDLGRAISQTDTGWAPHTGDYWWA